ncbi:hypothetical protein LEM8419_03343 [Neolewinella maritima]|uniref:DUF885 domain-containing protein n=1 Tax=Neolewinella maritima TaxID=1383882 RepID=A0ABM9B574_9BACT|nr:DUF885 domain-containing protein [Neolewinella maritima]CAH1002464.1 hypothetical protein LEM8419_03343 [Neolewinella maritima]
MPLFLFFLVLCVASSLSAQSDSARLENTLTAYLTFDQLSTGLPWRLDTEQSTPGQIAALTSFREALPDRDRLSDRQRIDRDLLAYVLDDRMYRLRFGHHLLPLDAEGGFLAEIIYRFSGRRVATEADYRKYLNDLRTLPDYLRGQEANLRRGLAQGKVHPRRVVELNLALIDRQLASPVGEGLFADPPERADWKQTAVTITRDTIYPAYAHLRRFLAEEYLPALPEEIGIAAITDGRDFYRQRIRYFTSDSLATPESVFATGEREVARIRAEMDTVIARTGFTGSFSDFLLHLRTAAQFYAASPQDLLDRASWITNRIQTAAPRYFSTLPRMPLVVAPVPAALAPNYTGGRYSQGSYDTRRAGQFWVNTYDLPSRPLYTLPALALHEGVPGHHTQIMLAAELEGLSDFRRDLYLSAFGEGWGLYAEYLGQEMGVYETDYDEFGRLTYEMWRACRLVVDPGMHYFGWSRERAVAYMAEHTALSLREVNSEVDRYIGWPGQAVSYKMGELKIRALRKEAEAALGARFDLAAFHAVVLGSGAVTMSLLAEHVRRYVAAELVD